MNPNNLNKTNINSEEVLSPEQTENLEQAIEFYLSALRFLDISQSPTEGAEISQRLGDIFAHRTRGHYEENLSQAQQFYEQALSLYNQSRSRVDIARVYRSLGDLHSRIAQKRIETSSSQTLERYKKALTSSISSIYRTQNIILVKSDDNKELTVEYFNSVVGPYLNAISELQHILDEIQGKPRQKIICRSITYLSPIDVSLEGVSQAIDSIKDIVVPWRRIHSREMSLLMEQEKQVDIDVKRVGIIESRGVAVKNKAEANRIIAEANKLKEETEKMRLENERLRLDLQQEKIQLTLDLINKIAPDMSQAEKIGYVIKLLIPVETLTSSELNIVTDSRME